MKRFFYLGLQVHKQMPTLTFTTMGIQIAQSRLYLHFLGPKVGTASVLDSGQAPLQFKAPLQFYMGR